MSAHTPGPWRSDFGNNRASIIAKIEHEVAQVFTLRSTNKEEDQNREVMIANARLIAAAPDLLEVASGLTELPAPFSACSLPGCVCPSCRFLGLREMALAAIKKVRGQ